MDESINVNPFMSSGAPGTMIDDFGGDNFDHPNLGFIGGQYVGWIMTGGRTIEFHPTPPGTPRWGLEWKRAVARHYNHTILIQQHGMSAPSRLNYLDLDPTYKDAWGQPLLRMTFDFPENDIRMSQYIAAKVGEIAARWAARSWSAGVPSGPTPPPSIKARTIAAAPSWVTIPKPASSIDTSSAGTCRTSSALVVRRFRRTSPTTTRSPSAQSRFLRSMRSRTNI